MNIGNLATPPSSYVYVLVLSIACQVNGLDKNRRKYKMDSAFYYTFCRLGFTAARRSEPPSKDEFR
jgi:hypothetical protein